ncbi:MAG: hypothetical protein HKN72_09555 [Gemmatimonadetes bacterium]|nr:hypothetical protein [Gemmatimonadota bacterium]
MKRSEAATLGFLVAFAAFAFLPMWRTIELWGMAVFGWLVAALMIVSPALALATFVAGRRRDDSDEPKGVSGRPGDPSTGSGHESD